MMTKNHHRAGGAIICAILCLINVTPALGQINGYLSGQDRERYTSLGKSAIKRSIPEEVYFGTKLLIELGETASVSEAGVCDVAQKLFSKYSGDPAAVAYGLGTLKEAGCPIESASSNSAVKATLQHNAESPSFTIKHQVLLANSVLNDDEIVPNMESAIKQLNKHRSDDGLFRETTEDREGTSDATFLMLELIASTKLSSKGIKKTIEKASTLLPGVQIDGESGVVDATLLSAVAKASPEPLELSDRQLQAIATSLLKIKSSSSVKTVYKVFTGINTLAGYPNAPFAVVMSYSTLQSASEPFQLEVRTLVGNPADGISVSVENVTVGPKKEEIASQSGRQVNGVGNGRYEGTLDVGPGLYDVSLIIGSLGNIVRRVVIQTSADIQDIEVSLSPSRKASEGKTYHVSRSQGLARGLEASASEGQYIITTFNVLSPVSPHQAFVRFTHLPTNVDTFFAAKSSPAAGEDTYKLTATVALADESTTFLHQSGDYQVSLLLGDATYSQPIEQNIGVLHLDFPPKAKQTYPLYKRPLLWDSDNALAPLPEIHHQFRQPERRPSPIVSAFFTGLVILALVFFLLYLPRVGANLKALPTGVGFLWSMGWLGCLSAILGLFTAYWVFLKGMTTLKYLFPVSVAAVFVGHQAFSYSAKSKAA